jgi:hypothetical protein
MLQDEVGDYARVPVRPRGKLLAALPRAPPSWRRTRLSLARLGAYFCRALGSLVRKEVEKLKSVRSVTAASNIGTPVRPTTAVIDAEVGVFQEAFNRRSFAFPHRLANHPLFTIPRLADAAQAVLDKGDGERFVVFDAKSFEAGTGFGTTSARNRLPESVRRLPEGRTWLKISSANEADPDYAEVLRQIIHDISELTGRDLVSEITWSSLTVFMASPGIVTPYHIDHESNFLFQVQGEKDVWLFDQDDRVILSDIEIEKFYAGDAEAARYKPNLRERGTVYHLTPGAAVHHPPLAPHLVRNGDSVSVSVSVGFCMRALDRRAKVYQFNNLMRRVGLRPLRPGRSNLRDRMKAAGLEMATKSNAVSREDILFSGFRRVTTPLRLVKNLQDLGNHNR